LAEHTKMAQTGYTPISIYYSSTAAATPTAGNLVAGELAINTADGKLFYKDSAGVVQVIGTKGGVGSSTTTQVLYNSSGLVVGSANLTFNGTTLTVANDASISGLTVGKGNGSVASATVVGASAMAAVNTGLYNSAFGNIALSQNTSGAQNTALGQYSLATNTTGSYLVAVGQASLNANTTGSSNTAVGQAALNANTTASNNTAVGYQAGYSNTTGTGLVAIGNLALYSNTTGSYSTAVGNNAGRSNTTGAITAVGEGALYANTTGSSNIAVGGFNGSVDGAMRFNTTGSFNVAVGTGALTLNTTASNNTAVGYQAGYSTTTGTNSVYLGYQTGYNATGTENCFLGAFAGNAVTTGTANTFVGRGTNTAAGYLVTTGSKNSILGGYSGNQGGLDIRTASNYIVLSDGDGNPRGLFDGSGNFIVGATSVYNSEKLNVTSSSSANSARTVNIYNSSATSTTRIANQLIRLSSNSNGGDVCINLTDNTNYNYYFGGANGTAYVLSGGSGGVGLTQGATSWSSLSDSTLKNVTGKYITALKDISAIEPVKFTWKLDKENKPQVGVLAQSVQPVVPEAVDADEDGLLSVRYTELIPLMIASIQELKAEVDSLKQQLGK